MAVSPDVIVFHHGEKFDSGLVEWIPPRESELFARGYLYLPARESVERGMVWTDSNTVDRHRPARPFSRNVRDLTDKLLGKYALVGAMIEKRGIARHVQVVQPGQSVSATSADAIEYRVAQ
jgi:hypothetical protein